MINAINQRTIDSNKNSLDALSEEPKSIEEARQHALRIRKALQDEVEKGDVAIRLDGVKVIIHILEKASFQSGRADIRRSFKPILHKISYLIDSNDGVIKVAGHTDNLPIANSRFRSNWELSTSRAVSVAHELLQNASLDPYRFVVVGHAETRPLVGNDTIDDRARNRRVDISITHGILDDIEKVLSVENSYNMAANGSPQ